MASSTFHLLALAALCIASSAALAQPAKIDDALADSGLKALDAKDAALRRAIQRASPSLVAIYLRERSEFDQQFPFERNQRRFPRRMTFEDDEELRAAALGAGIVLERTGHILTCYHLVRAATEPGAKYDLNVRTQDGMLYSINREDVLAGDPRSDLAVIKVAPSDPKTFVPAPFGDGGALFVGQTVLALGNAFGVGVEDGAVSASLGQVSSIGRRADPIFPASTGAAQQRAEKSKHLLTWGPLVQVDCRMNLGTSGGALINTRGEVVGITMALAARVGMETPGGFVLPYDKLTRKVVETLKQGKEMEYGFLGVRPVNFSKAEARAKGLPEVDGVLMDSVVLSSTRRDGLHNGDVVVAVDGQPVRNRNELVLRVGGCTAGQKLRFKVVRPRGETEVVVRLGKFPIPGPVVATNVRPAFAGLRVDFLSLLSDDYPGQPGFFGESNPTGLPASGVMVSEVEPGSPADAAGIAPKSVIVSVNGAGLETPDEFVRAVQAAKGPVKLVVQTAASRMGLVEWRPRTVELTPAKPKAKTTKDANDH